MHFKADTQALERAGDVAQVIHRGILNGKSAAEHGRHADETAHFDHIGQDDVLCAVE